jgi:hypothetical protein
MLACLRQQLVLALLLFLGKNLPGYEDYRRKVQHRLIPYVW